MGMTHKKIWSLFRPNPTHEDAIFIKGLGCEVKVIVPEPIEVTSANGRSWKVQTEYPHIELTTTCEKQESMLHLKYGDELRLKTIIHRKLEPSYADIDLVSHSRSTAL